MTAAHTNHKNTKPKHSHKYFPFSWGPLFACCVTRFTLVYYCVYSSAPSTHCVSLKCVFLFNLSCDVGHGNISVVSFLVTKYGVAWRCGSLNISHCFCCIVPLCRGVGIWIIHREAYNQPHPTAIQDECEHAVKDAYLYIIYVHFRGSSYPGFRWWNEAERPEQWG